MKIKLIKISFNINFVLIVALVLVLLFELYLGYVHIFKNFQLEPAEAIPSNIVRVNLENYRQTVDFLDQQANFAAGPVNLKRVNPFRP